MAYSPADLQGIELLASALEASDPRHLKNPRPSTCERANDPTPAKANGPTMSGVLLDDIATRRHLYALAPRALEQSVRQACMNDAKANGGE
jgi:hypothetical protein